MLVLLKQNRRFRASLQMKSIWILCLEALTQKLRRATES